MHEFLASIYLGDRACKGLVIDSWGNRLKIMIDVISRVRSGTGEWNFYDAEDITDGSLVLAGLHSLRLEPPGPLPNDFINVISARRVDCETNPLYEFTISVSSVDNTGHSTEVVITALAQDAYLEDPRRLGLQIR